MAPPAKTRSKPLTTNEIIDLMTDLQSDDEMTGLDIYIDPPGDGLFSDSDSGDETNVSFENLSRRQLLAPAELVLHHININDDSESHEDGCLPSSEGFQTRQDRPSEVPTSSQPRRSHTRKWVKRDLPTMDNEWIAPPPRSVVTVSDASDPIDFFELFFSHEVVNHIVRHTVMYAVEKGKMSFTLSIDEIYCFVGILILTGYCPLPRRRMYWESNEDTHNMLIAKSMRRNRFEEILRYFHVADNSNLVPGDKMVAKWQKDISIDESMIPYYGRHSCKQHIRGKPIRFGFKTWVAALRLGYCLHADLYQGKFERVRTGLGQHVVHELMNEIKAAYQDTKFSIYIDNFFTGLPLITEMKEENVLVTGTVRNNRIEKCPLKDVKLCKKEQRGYYDSRLDLNSNICAVRWHDNSVVTMLSSEYGVAPLRTARRYSAVQKARVEVPQPDVVYQYNRFMGGVDRLDANVATYRIAIRGKKWYIPIIFWLIDVAVNNATLIAREIRNDVDTLEFRRSIARTLLQKYGVDKRQPGPSKRVFSTVPASVRKCNAEHNDRQGTHASTLCLL